MCFPLLQMSDEFSSTNRKPTQRDGHVERRRSQSVARKFFSTSSIIGFAQMVAASRAWFDGNSRQSGVGGSVRRRWVPLREAAEEILSVASIVGVAQVAVGRSLLFDRRTRQRRSIRSMRRRRAQRNCGRR